MIDRRLTRDMELAHACLKPADQFLYLFLLAIVLHDQGEVHQGAPVAFCHPPTKRHFSKAPSLVF